MVKLVFFCIILYNSFVFKSIISEVKHGKYYYTVFVASFTVGFIFANSLLTDIFFVNVNNVGNAVGAASAGNTVLVTNET